MFKQDDWEECLSFYVRIPFSFHTNQTRIHHKKKKKILTKPDWWDIDQLSYLLYWESIIIYTCFTLTKFLCLFKLDTELDCICLSLNPHFNLNMKKNDVLSSIKRFPSSWELFLSIFVEFCNGDVFPCATLITTEVDVPTKCSN